MESAESTVLGTGLLFLCLLMFAYYVLSNRLYQLLFDRLEEIPFGKMGKGRNQRILPYLLAANTVNYGKPYKMNTAEATAACLYIVGFKKEAHTLLSPFSYGEEFIRLNFECLEAYSNCATEMEVRQVMKQYELALGAQKERKEERIAQQTAASTLSGNIGGYMDDMDLPPRDDDDEYYYDDEEEEVGAEEA